ncbi:MAG TPA: bifunctional diguanylate cyclase/phosphodiesterase [Caulobacteraceae bacterium]
MQWLLAGFAIVGAAGTGAAWARWATARRFGRVLPTLYDAARALERSEPAHAPAPDGSSPGLVQSFNAMTEAADERERVLTELAMSDPETGLPNRRALEAELDALIATGAHGVAAVAFSLDGFASLGATIGQEATVGLLNHVARRLAEKTPAAMVGLLSPDTLGVVFGSGGAQAAAMTAEGLAAELQGPAPVGETTIDVSLSVGVAPAEASDIGLSPLPRAAIAADQARAGRRRVAVFAARAYGDPAANLTLVAEMRRAIETGRMEAHLQPKYDLRQGRIAGVEVLARWTHPKRGLLSPGLFVRLAEATGHIRALTDHMLARAIADQAALRRAGHALEISVNVTGGVLADAGFVEHVLSAAKGAEGRVCLEVTEAGLVEHPEQVAAHIERLADAGVGVAIDNFGAGPLPLTWLRRIRAEEVKIDQSLILDVADARRNALLVRGAVELAHGLGMKVTAKGVETNEACALLTSLGCDFAQGFLIERPMPLEELIAFLAQDRAAVRYG